MSAKEAKIKIFTISFDVLSIEKCILCDKAAKQHNHNARITTSGGTDKRPASSNFFTPQSGKNFACLLKDDDVNDATHVLPLPVGDVYGEGPLIRVFRSVSLTLTDGGQA